MQRSISPDTCEESIYNEIFRTYSTDLRNFIYYNFGDDFQPEDVVQESFLKLGKNCKDVPFEKAKSYLYTVANNHALNLASKKKTILKYNQQHNFSGETNESPEFLMEQEQFHSKLKSALESLTEDQRVVFMLNKVEGKRHKEIAEMLGISRKAVEKRLYKAISILKGKIENI
jgi:RNA polymerase sigma-70 factor (ECF subfamily)